MQAYWWHRDAVARTADDGTFDIPCPEGVVLLNAFPLFKAQDGSTPNWRTTYVGGGTLLTEAHRPTCSGEPETTVVPEGAVIEGTVHPLPTCQVGAWHVRVESDPGGHIAYDQDWLQTPIRADGTFRLAGLPP